ncbi:unnamed protein product [Peronospora farinosa]|nr:unnamed protein product [Peronospora farinosa]
MRNAYFLSDVEEIDIKSVGREHIHYLNCKQGQKDKCVYSESTTDQRRHCTRALKPKQENETDEVLHE